MNQTTFLEKLNQNPTEITFAETIAFIDQNYQFTPTPFLNGNQLNGIGENSGSCKIFAFAQLNDFTKDQTLACFGAYYFDEVLNFPEGTNHQNIRNFMQFGWDGIRFEGEALLLNS